jgi:hypothetical protein
MQVTVVIQCAARKHGAYLRDSSGNQIAFCAHPSAATARPGWIFAHPDDVASFNSTWRGNLSAYNEKFALDGANPDGLSAAWQLYSDPSYGKLAQAVGTNNLYIMSAGWGLVGTNYRLPNYDITFNTNAGVVAIRRKADLFRDLTQLPDEVGGSVLFFGRLSYLSMFCRLTSGIRAERIVYYNSDKSPDAPGCRLVRYVTKGRTNWHYRCALDFASRCPSLDRPPPLSN